MAVILQYTKSTYGNPYAYYKAEITGTSNRTATTVDLTLKITSKLATSGSSFGSGYTLRARLYTKGKWSDYIEVKASNATWSGTTEHTKTATITTTNVGSSDTELTNVYFQVVSSAGDKACQLNTTACSNITIPSFHTPPLINSYTMAETNALLTNAGIDDDVFVNGLSQKEFTINYNLYEGATFTDATAYNGITNVYDNTSAPIDEHNVKVLMDLTTNSTRVDNSGVPIFVSVTDSQNVRSYYSNTGGSVISAGQMDYYTFINYLPISITTTTKARRLGQTSGRVELNIEGIVYNGEIGIVDQSSYKPTIKYKYWKYGDSEPATYTNIISSSDISVSDGVFSVSSLDIGSSTETDPNYFDPEYAWRIKVYVEDNFTNAESNELQIQVGEATWTEYKDRVNFKKLTIQDEGIIVINDYLETISSLTSGGTTTLSYDITKAGYTPIGIVGISSGNSAVNIYGMRLISTTEANVSVRNIYTSSISNVGVRIYVAYIRS